jgi:hypothetical protein
MNETEILNLLQKSGAGAQTVAAVALVYLAVKVRAMDSRIRAISDVINACPTCRRHANIVPLAIVVIVAGALLGCVKTSFTHGGTTMTRTAVLTRVTVPSLTISTNGTVKASVESDARTELLEAFFKVLSSVK